MPDNIGTGLNWPVPEFRSRKYLGDPKENFDRSWKQSVNRPSLPLS
jgi:hypothetical protein